MKENTKTPIPDEEKCIGCRACTSACPEKLITFSEEAKLQSISFPANCRADCELCALACPEKAISFIYPEGAEESQKSQVPPESRTLYFELVPCQNCGTAFATAKELEKVRSAISEKVPLSPFGGFWVELCPGCRQAVFRERQAETLIQARKF